MSSAPTGEFDLASSEYAEYADLSTAPAAYDDSYQQLLQPTPAFHFNSSAPLDSSASQPTAAAAQNSAASPSAASNSGPIDSIPAISANSVDSEFGRSVYVENLTIPTSDDELFELFSKFGEIEKIKLSTDRVTGKQLGYAFVLFFESESASTAVATMHGHQHRGRQFRVSIAKQKGERSGGAAKPQNFAPPPATGGGSSNSNLYVANFPISWDKAAYEAFFSKYGTIVESKILIDLHSRESKGVGFVRFSDEESVTQATNELNGQLLDGCTVPLVVRPATDRKTMAARTSAPPASSGPGPNRNSAGRAESRFNPMQRGATANRGVSQTPGAPATGGDGPASDFPLFVLYVPNGMTENDLHQLFSLYGPVLNVQIPRDRQTNVIKGYAFVHMQNYRDAQNAIQYLNGHQVENKRLKVSFKDQKDGTGTGSGSAPRLPPPMSHHMMSGHSMMPPMGMPMMPPMMPMMGMPPMMPGMMPQMGMPPMMAGMPMMPMMHPMMHQQQQQQQQQHQSNNGSQS